MRDFSILGTIIIVSVFLGIGFYVFGGPAFHGQSTVAAGANSPIRFTVLEIGSNAPAMSERVNYRIMSVDELGQLWQMVYGGNGPAIPSVDFSKDDVIAVFDGSHSQSGYSIAISRIEDVDGKRLVTVTRTSPPSTCTGNEAASAPFEIASVAKSDLPLDHADQPVAGTSCTN